MIKGQVFVNKHLPVQTQRSKHQQRIFDLFKLIKQRYYSNATDVILSVVVISFRHFFTVHLLFIPHATSTYHITVFSITSMEDTLSKHVIFFLNHTVTARLKNQEGKPQGKGMENLIFFIISTTWDEQQKLGMDFIIKLYK